jgi:D-cysteine desulfhydrase
MPWPERLALAHLPTPIQRLTRTPLAGGAQLWLWRDDLSGGMTSGNKVRKLEFLLAEARAQGATRLVTCGGPQSNHARATVFLARRLGLDVTVVVREPPPGRDEGSPGSIAAVNGNALLARLAGAELVPLPFADYVAAGSSYEPAMAAVCDAARARGERPYAITEGGSSALGAVGYVAAVDELLATWRREGPGTPAPDAIFLAVGSGGTLAGVQLGWIRNGLRPDAVCGVNVCNDAAYFRARVGKLCDEAASRYGLPRLATPLSLFGGYVGRGYARASDDDLRFYAELAAREGVLLDPVYTGKAFRGMLAETAKEPERFGKHVVFLHSGGVFATFAYAEQYAGALAATNKP